MSSCAATQPQQTPGVFVVVDVVAVVVVVVVEAKDPTSRSRSQAPASQSAGNAVKYFRAFHSWPVFPVSLQTRTHWTKRAAYGEAAAAKRSRLPFAQLES